MYMYRYVQTGIYITFTCIFKRSITRWSRWTLAIPQWRPHSLLRWAPSVAYQSNLRFSLRLSFVSFFSNDKKTFGIVLFFWVVFSPPSFVYLSLSLSLSLGICICILKKEGRYGAVFHFSVLGKADQYTNIKISSLGVKIIYLSKKISVNWQQPKKKKQNSFKIKKRQKLETFFFCSLWSSEKSPWGFLKKKPKTKNFFNLLPRTWRSRTRQRWIMRTRR